MNPHPGALGTQSCSYTHISRLGQEAALSIPPGWCSWWELVGTPAFYLTLTPGALFSLLPPNTTLGDYLWEQFCATWANPKKWNLQWDPNRWKEVLLPPRHQTILLVDLKLALGWVWRAGAGVSSGWACVTHLALIIPASCSHSHRHWRTLTTS